MQKILSWYTCIGLKKNSSVDLEIFIFYFFTYFTWLIYHLPLISDWFSNIFPQRIPHFLQLVILNTIGIGNFNGWLLKISIPEKPLAHMVISQKAGQLSTWFWYQVTVESILFTMITKTHFTQNVTSSLFCVRAWHMLIDLFMECWEWSVSENLEIFWGAPKLLVIKELFGRQNCCCIK